MGRISKHVISKLFQFSLGVLVGHLVMSFLIPLAQVRTHRVRLKSNQELNLGPRIPIFAGVMTAGKYLNSRGCSSWRSWGADLVKRGGEVRYFVGTSDSGLPPNACNLPVVVLQGIRDEDYPPQRKSFAMFRWIEQHYGNRSSWFLRTDDDVYLNVERMLDFLGGLDGRDPHFIGQAGRGLAKEEGKLSLQWNQNFCMGGTGMVLSQTILRMFVPKIDTCLTNLMTGHEDVEVGRCITMATGSTCTWAYEMQTLFYHSSGGKDDRGVEILPDTLNLNIINNAITIHPIKSPKNMEILSVKYKTMKRLHTMTEIKKLEFDLHLINEDPVDEFDDLSDLPRMNQTWDFIYSHQIYKAEAGHEKGKIPARLNQSITRIISKVVDKINADAREKGRSIEFRDLYYAYVNHDPKYGNSFILDILLVYKKFQGKKMTVKVRRHVFVREILLEPHFKPQIGSDTSPVPAVVPGDTPNYYEDDRRSITLLVTVAGESKVPVLKRFLAEYEKEVLLKMNPVKLVVVAFKETSQDLAVVNLLRAQVQYLEKEFPGFVITVVELNQSFSRGVGLTKGLEVCDESDLVFIVDVDISFTSATLDNVRRFTVEGKSVYFPIVFSEFRDGGGYWRDYGYGIMSGYKKDIVSVGGYNLDFKGWGKEDVDLYDKFLKSSIKAFRSTDSYLVHKYHKVTCSPSLPNEQATMCAGSRANTFLPLETLFHLVVNSSVIIP